MIPTFISQLVCLIQGVYLARVSQLRFGPLLMVVCYYNVWKIILKHAWLCRFYIGCDKCQDWFHGTCVGITATEADNIEFYTCPKCTQSQTQASKQPLTSKDYETLKRLLRSLQVGWSLFLTLKRDISVYRLFALISASITSTFW